MELKPFINNLKTEKVTSINRTFMELKQCSTNSDSNTNDKY